MSKFLKVFLLCRIYIYIYIYIKFEYVRVCISQKYRFFFFFFFFFFFQRIYIDYCRGLLGATDLNMCADVSRVYTYIRMRARMSQRRILLNATVFLLDLNRCFIFTKFILVRHKAIVSGHPVMFNLTTCSQLSATLVCCLIDIYYV